MKYKCFFAGYQKPAKLVNHRNIIQLPLNMFFWDLMDATDNVCYGFGQRGKAGWGLPASKNFGFFEKNFSIHWYV
jgi:hypothetical protein